MEFPSWFKKLWWAVLLIVFGAIIGIRSGQILESGTKDIDLIAIGIFIALALAPIFQEFNILGFKFKQELQRVKDEVRHQIDVFRTEVNASIRADVSPTFYLGGTPPDSMLKEMEERIINTVRETSGEQGIRGVAETEALDVAEDVRMLFSARHNIEKEITRIYSSTFSYEDSPRRMPTFHVPEMLVKRQIISPDLAQAIRDVYRVCSPAIHGEPVTSAQVEFVKDVAPKLLATLKSIS